MKKGEKEPAIEYYRKSLELNPKNENGREMLKKIEGQRRVTASGLFRPRHPETPFWL
jgi:hypothetical protein